MQRKSRKVVVVGAGSVGITYVYALMHTGLVGEIVLIDTDQKRLVGELMDLNHGLFFVPPVLIRAGDYTDCADADLIVITAGAKQTPGQSRLELIQENINIQLEQTQPLRSSKYLCKFVLKMSQNVQIKIRKPLYVVKPEKSFSGLTSQQNF